MEKTPDMLINHDTQILAQILQMAMGKNNGNGVSITLNSVNQLNLYLEGAKTQKINSPDQKVMLPAAKRGPVGIPKEEILRALNEAGWSRSKAAEILMVNRATMTKYVKIHGIQPPSGQWPDRRRRLNA